MEAPQKVQDLVEHFGEELDTFKSGRYNETQVRIEFVNPFFNQLGWDIENKSGFAHTYCDVIHEYSLETAEGIKAPDYCFRIGGVPKFFLETKKPSVHIKDDLAPAFQIRRYAWSAKLSLSILTDFEEFAVYDCRIKPHQRDKASVARIFYCTYQEYLSRWDEIAKIFSKDAIQKGAFDKFIDSDARKKGTSEVDKAFLEDMEKWRNSLARNIAVRNTKLSQKELNHLVQATIDRIVFLRICEDRKIEPYARLQKLIANDEIYPKLSKLFQQADDKYNSGLFHFKQEKGRDNPDILSLNLSIDDKPLKDIIKQLYYPESPYVFSKIPTEILGQVYEKFLGKVIRLTPSHQAKVEFKPEVRKAGGVYYTPQYIVDYIVQNTVGELLKKKSPAQAKKLRILDPACGSGSFLLGAYQHLLDWYLETYSKEPSKYKKQIYKGASDEWVLTSQEKKEILLNNIYGVDIDRQAVEVSKLSLLLKVLEGESNETLKSQLRLFHERALPDLSHNIKCGNSLIGTDFFHEKNLEMFARDDMESINAFDWDSEDGFAEIMQAGGFDAVIGNPPYGYLFEDKNIFQYILDNYYTAEYKVDSYTVFLERAMLILNKNSIIGFIIPYTFISGKYFSKTRLFLKNYYINKLVIIGQKVFHSANVDTIIITAQNNLINKPLQIADMRSIANISSLQHLDYFSLSKENAFSDTERKLLISNEKTAKLYMALSLHKINLAEVLEFYHGLQTKGDKKAIIYNKEKSLNDVYPLIKGRDFFRYQFKPEKKYIVYKKENIKSGGNLKYHFSTKKIIIRTTGDRLIATVDYSKSICLNSINIGISINSYELLFTLGIINSNLAKFWYDLTVQEQGKTFAEVKITYIEKLPIPKLNLSNPTQKSQHDRMVELVDQMLDTQKELHASESEHDRKHYQQRADILDKQIDTLVYELYELTPEEIEIVEGAR